MSAYRYLFAGCVFMLCASLAMSVVAQQPAAKPEKSGTSEAAVHKLPLRRVVLYKSGVGYFEHDGAVHGNQDVEIDLTSGQLNDVLKSLTALDLTGGRVVGASYSSQEPAGHQLASLPLPVADRTTLTSLLQGLRGAQLEVRTGATAFSGRLLSVEDKTRRSGTSEVRVPEVSLMSEAGEVRSFAIEPGTSLRFADRTLEQELGRALGLLDASHAQDTRRLVLSTTGAGDRELRVSYISEVPVWKTTYRLVIPSVAGAKPLLQGWAIVDNTVGEDWDNVELSLAAGAPQSFIQQLSQPYYTRRPEVPLPQGYMLTPQTHAATLIGESSLQGNVNDPSGASVAGAMVRVTDDNGNEVAQTETDGDGIYSFSKLLPGGYKVEFSKDGFQRSTFTGVSVRTGQTTVVNVSLHIGSASTTVEVTAEAGAQLQSLNGGVGDDIIGGNVAGAVRDLASVTRQTMNLATLSPAAAARNSIIAAQGSVLGDLFEYKLKDRVTIRKNQSALVPILQTDISAEKVSLWNSEMSVSRPLRALWLTNSSSLVLDGGSFSVLDGGAFGGEGIVDAIEPGERRLISYAIDLAVQVETRNGMEQGKFTRTRIARGVMIRTSEEHQRMTYTIRNEDTSARTVVIEHPVHPGWKLASNLHPDEQTDSAYRFRVNVEPKHTSTFTAEETRANDVQYRLSGLDDTTLELFIHQGTVNAEIEAALRQILAQKTAVAHLEAELRAKQQESDDIFKDQERVRENMKALKGTPEEKSLTERYTKELGDQETQLGTLKQQIADLDVQKQKAQQDLEAMIQKLSFDVTF
jgi:hypothetical protein